MAEWMFFVEFLVNGFQIADSREQFCWLLEYPTGGVQIFCEAQECALTAGEMSTSQGHTPVPKHPRHNDIKLVYRREPLSSEKTLSSTEEYLSKHDLSNYDDIHFSVVENNKKYLSKYNVSEIIPFTRFL